jgi:hypothetical protein
MGARDPENHDSTRYAPSESSEVKGGLFWTQSEHHYGPGYKTYFNGDDGHASYNIPLRAHNSDVLSTLLLRCVR